MPTKIGPFEILSELAKSSTSVVYKANDPQSGQTVALKAIQLSAFGEKAGELEKCLLAEAESSKVLASSNVTPVYGAGEIEGRFCAAMEYVQGNSIATMLARKEGFSIWDLLDIGRQVCSGLDHAHGHNVFHYSLEPSKIMCGWDGTVKILSFGLSSVGKFADQVTDGVPSILYYMSPEQMRGEAIDARSNLFSLGAMFYETVTDHKAFPGGDFDTVRNNVLQVDPVPPVQVNPKIHPLLSDLIMKALAKDPGQRYQSGRELLDDLEKCKDSRPQAAAKPAAAPPRQVAVPEKAKAAAASKFAAGAVPPARPAAASPSPTAHAGAPKPAAPPVQKPASSAAVSRPATPVIKPEAPKVASAVAAGATAGGARTITPTAAPPKPQASQSAPVVNEIEVETFENNSPGIAVDPMMAEDGPSRAATTSFSEIDELPPLKEVYIAPPPPPPVSPEQPEISIDPVLLRGRTPEKPKAQPREVAHKAMKEIKGVPPRLMMYSVAGAIGLILLIGLALAAYIHLQNSDDDNGAAQSTAAPVEQAAPAKQAVAAQEQPAHAPDDVTQAAVPTVVEEPAPSHSLFGRGRNAKRRGAAAAPFVIPGQMAVESTPPGAMVQIDGKADPSWVTPYTMAGLAPGQHTVAISKTGYSTDTRTIEVASGSKAFVAIHLAPLMATLSISSNPAGANILVDGKDTRKLTPARLSLDKGTHTILLRKAGYLDETASSQLVQGEIASLSPALRPLGNVDDMRTVGKFKKMFGGNGGQGMGTVSVKTQPKGAQIAVNQHMLDKTSPVDFLLNPGNYIIDISLSGYAPVRKVIVVDKSGKVVVDEALQPQ